MPLNPRYEERQSTSSEDRPPFWNANEMGDKIVGVIERVSDVLTLQNKKYDPSKDAPSKKTYEKQFVTIVTDSGKFTISLGWQDFPVIGRALKAAELDDLTSDLIGWTFGWKWASVAKSSSGSLTRVMEARFVPPAS